MGLVLFTIIIICVLGAIAVALLVIISGFLESDLPDLIVEYWTDFFDGIAHWMER